MSIADEFQNDVLVSSFYEAALSTTRESDPSIPIAFRFGSDIEGGLNVTREYDAEVLHPSYDLIQGTPFFEGEVDIDLVDVAYEDGRTVNVWAVKT
ncbi:hypothetical protein ACFFQF_28435 [Haladaptatus pallidirubidus]|uniref:Halobacterial output domain-containing protein n=1 Tax=Haladaptatus pallidirubidus TaxID=1008152 RepID=A0AAV3UJJ0_9EURY|nr:hypothetical protein [Haladaptatus pallidirubidus]